MDALVPIINEDKRTKCERVVTNFILTKGRGKYKINEIFHYKDTSSMMVFIIQRIK